MRYDPSVTVPSELGPQDMPDNVPAVSPAPRQVLACVADAKEGLTVNEIAQVLGGHANRSRAHLERLTNDGLISFESAHSGGRGRPSRRYFVTTKGRQVLAADAGVDYRTITHVFTDYLAEHGDADAAIDIGKRWSSKALAEVDVNSESHISAMLAFMEKQGFSPEVIETPEGQTIDLWTCPFIDEARENPQVVCAIHRGLIEGVLADIAPTANAALMPFYKPGACGVRFDRAPAGSVGA